MTIGLLQRTIMFALAFGTGVIAALYATKSPARDNGQWGHDEATQQWFKSLKNPLGVPCCDYSDGSRVEDPDWKGPNDDGSYDVKWGNIWVHINKDHIVAGNNKVGYAILWRSPSMEPNEQGSGVYCFLPGAGG